MVPKSIQENAFIDEKIEFCHSSHKPDLTSVLSGNNLGFMISGFTGKKVNCKILSSLDTQNEIQFFNEMSI